VKLIDVIGYLNSKHIEWRRRGENAIFNCPQCGDTEYKFAVSLVSGAYNCLHLNNCGIKGSFSQLQKLYGDTPSRSDRHYFINSTPKTFTRPKTTIKPATPPVIAYLGKRGLTAEVREAFKVGAFDDDTVMLPYYRNGDLVNVKYRSISDKKKMRTEKDAEPILYNRDNIQDNERLVICEGEYDAMALHRYNIEAVSVPMGAGNHQWIEQEWEYLETYKEIYLCFDQDAAGRKAAREVAAKLGEWRCRIVNLPAKDANECLMKKLPVAESFEDAEVISPETLVSTMYFEENVQELFRMGARLFGTETAWKELDAKLKGWRGGEVTIWSGRNGSGKSTILNQHILDIAGKDVKSCIYSGEMPPERYLRWAVVQYTGNDAPSPAFIKNALMWMDGKIYILNLSSSVTPEKLLSDFEYAARRYNVKHFIIDSLMKVNLDLRDENNSQKEFVNRLTEFAKKFKVHVHLVAHPRKTNSDDDAPGKVDVKGSGHITDLADNVIVMNRTSDEQKENAMLRGKTISDAQLFVKKNREFGIEGKVHLWFDERTKRYTDAKP